MEPLRLKPRQPVEDEIENWDDDDFLGGDDLSFRSSFNNSNAPSRRRGSASSHASLRSDLESWNGEEQHVHIPEDNESSTMDAIAAAERAGVPLPKNVPSSALMGGTIKRLGGRTIRKIIQEDWEHDLELPEASQVLKMKTKEANEFPDTLRQVSGGSEQTSPTRAMKSPVFMPQDNRRTSAQSNTSALSSAINLDRFKDADEDDFFGDGSQTIKVSKTRVAPKPVSFITPPTPQKAAKSKELEDDFERDLELPSDGKLKLSTRRDIPKTPLSQADDLDWGEGSSLGTRYGGTRRDGRSNRSSSASALSPSVSSSITAESEDEALDGLVLPAGPLNFQQRLQQRKKSPSPNRIEEAPTSAPKQAPTAEADRQDFLDGLEIGDANMFDAGKLTLHRNIKIKDAQPTSPARPKTAVSVTFTNKASAQTRIPRLSHERAHSISLEPVYESSGPQPQRSRRSQSRLGHSAQSSVSSVQTPTTTSPGHSTSPTTPRRREITTKSSYTSLRTESSTATTSAQLLRQKRSLPAVRALNSPAKPVSGRFERPASRTDTARPQSGMRPKTPVERCKSAINDSPAQTRRPQPFLPAGASQTQSQHASSKTRGLRQFRRHDSDNAIDIRPFSRSVSRSAMRSPSPHRYKVAADTWERLSRPKNKKNFGDGHELDAFDDLPTSKDNETRFLRQPLTTGPKVAQRNKSVLPDRMTTPVPLTPMSPVRNPMSSSQTPRFARDTAASRRARETSLAQRAPSNGPLAPVTAQRVAQLSTRSNVNMHPNLPQPTVRSKKQAKRPPQLKPHLISNLNTGKESKVVNGMYYNAETFRWEGNENALNVFDGTISTPTTTIPPNMMREKEIGTPRPALISNINATKGVQGVQVVGGMVFDPQNMCWVKIGPQSKARSDATDSLDGFNALDDDEDVFKDIPDLDDNAAEEEREGRVSDVKDDWLVGEEFDVGPEFVRRQREEEDRWRKKCEKWAVARRTRDRETWRWTIRELVSQFDDLPM